MKLRSMLVLASLQVALTGCGNESSSSGRGIPTSSTIWTFTSPPSVTVEEAESVSYVYPEYYPSAPVNGTGISGQTGTIFKMSTEMPPDGFVNWTDEQKTAWLSANLLDTYNVTPNTNNQWSAGSDDEVGFFTYLLTGPETESVEHNVAIAVILPEAP